MTGQGDRVEQVRAFLVDNGWTTGEPRVRFLAAGEYNENYLITTPDSDEGSVFRINHGTQLNLDDQIGYEYAVLERVAPSKVTPVPLRLCRTHHDFPRGALLMSYLPGRPLDYVHDLSGAALCFARIHELPCEPDAERLVVQADPVSDIVSESRGLMGRYPDHPLHEEGTKIRWYLERVAALAEHARFGDEPLCIVNTEVNSGNFLVQDSRVRLVDWEKAVVSYRYQDLGHFLVPTTTLWKTDFRFDAGSRRRFLEEYHAAARPPIGIDELDERTALLERTILLRAFSWVYMAYAEYSSGARTLRNPDTFRTIKRYLREIDVFLGIS